MSASKEPAIDTILLDKALFRDHLPFWRQLVGLDAGQRMVLWASIQRRAYQEVGLDYCWESSEPQPLLPIKAVDEAQDTTIADSHGRYL